MVDIAWTKKVHVSSYQIAFHCRELLRIVYTNDTSIECSVEIIFNMREVSTSRRKGLLESIYLPDRMGPAKRAIVATHE